MAGVRGLDHINLRVPADLLEPVRAFYVDMVGLHDGARPAMPSRGYWLYAGDAAVLHLGMSSIENPSEANGSFSHVAFACTELEATRQRLDEANVPHRIAVLDDGARCRRRSARQMGR
jgi:4-hydroxyphenylpyruvate dioxygenase-like putative hemolysin